MTRFQDGIVGFARVRQDVRHLGKPGLGWVCLRFFSFGHWGHLGGFDGTRISFPPLCMCCEF